MINGSRRWLRLGMFSFQPSELAKFAVVVYMSYYIAKKGEALRDFMNGLVPAYVVIGVFLLVASRQPDFGATMTLAGVAGIMLFAGGANLLHLGGTVLAALPVVYVAVAHSAYRARRIFSFLDPWADPQGAGHQIIQSFLAFGSGGVFGRGLGEGRQKLLFLPERHSDFIYAVIGEELGLIGALAVVALFLIILWRGVRIALASGDHVQPHARARHHAPDLRAGDDQHGGRDRASAHQGHRAPAGELRRFIARDHDGGARGAAEYLERNVLKKTLAFTAENAEVAEGCKTKFNIFCPSFFPVVSASSAVKRILQSY